MSVRGRMIRRTCDVCGQENVAHTVANEPIVGHVRQARHELAVKMAASSRLARATRIEVPVATRQRYTIRVGPARKIVFLDGARLKQGVLNVEINTDGANCACGERLPIGGLLLTEKLGPRVECGNCGAQYAVDEDAWPVEPTRTP